MMKYTSTTKRGEDGHSKNMKKEKNKCTGWKPKTEEQSVEIKKKGVGKERRYRRRS